MRQYLSSNSPTFDLQETCLRVRAGYVRQLGRGGKSDHILLPKTLPSRSKVEKNAPPALGLAPWRILCVRSAWQDADAGQHQQLFTRLRIGDEIVMDEIQPSG